MSIARLVLQGLLVSATGCAVAATPAPAQSLNEAMPSVRHALSIVDGRFEGAGASVLTDAIHAARYVLIGEEHFTREVPQFAASVCDVMAPDLAAIAVEAGPSAAEALSASLGTARGEAEMRELLTRYPDSIAFLNGREERAFISHCAASVAPRPLALWGLDQEFLGAALRLFELMQATRPGPRATAALARLIAAERVVDQTASASGDPSSLWLLSASEAAVDDLRGLIDSEGNPRARALMAELAASRSIYRKNAIGGPAANRERALLMKRHLAADLAQAALKPDRKVLFKFGGNHAFKGYGPLGQLDLGNQVAERSDAEGAMSLHILVVAASGTAGSYGGHAKPLQPEAIDPTADGGFTWPLPFIEGRLSTGWTLYDLRRLRGLPLPGSSPGAKRLIEGYDLLVIVANATAGTLIAP